MSDEEKNAGNAGTATAAAAGAPSEQPSLDEHTTEPNAPSPEEPAQRTTAGNWQMPKPKFQQTSGYLPQGYLNKLKQAATGEAGPAPEDPAQEQAASVTSPASQDAGGPAAVPAVEPQPDLADQLIPEEPVEAAEARTPVGSGSSLPVILFWLIGAVIFIVVFLFVVFFLILAKPASGNNF